MLPNPYTVGYETIEDVTAWQLWWEFNRDAYLDLASLDTRVRGTGDDDFFLGVGQRVPRAVGGRATAETVQTKIVPILLKVIQSGGNVEVTRETILATAKACRQADKAGFWMALRHFLAENGNVTIKSSAALSFGIMGGDEWIDVLRHVVEPAEPGPNASHVAQQLADLAALGTVVREP